ncbi:HAD-IC family P-type ATPase [Paracoccus sp. TK19116]|uniref:HAD-IC family P-type ATPase n=1 Tax=Paracoccus albicereus TaxID=2922394 RepID=A0ABT1MUC8_9RHOB|nr:HAD-IC family P-type ATPase [Paracoccus albicereus]MCQ0971939.1 HAD-IC family P-type ATPase [Paracoccus albicereus]
MRRLFAIEGLACAGCARGLERRLAEQPAIRLAKVHYLTASALDWDETRTVPEIIAGHVARAGYRLIDRHRPEELQAMLDKHLRQLGVRLAVAVLSGMWTMALAFVLYTTQLAPDTAWWIALASGGFALPVIWAGRGILWMGWKSLQLREPTMDLLVSLGVTGALMLSAAQLLRGGVAVWFDAATMLLTLLLLARLIDTMIRRSALRALRAMQGAAPEIATVEAEGQRRRMPAHQVPLGSRVIVDAGEAATVDGVIETGDSWLNRAVLTGESRPIAVHPGDRIEAGCVNLDRRLAIRSDREPGDREIDRLGGAIALEIARCGAEGGMAERWAGVLARAIPALAIAATIAVMLRGLGAEQAVMTGLAVLAGLCPCALALAVPLTRLRVSQRAAGSGDRIREPSAFEKLAHARTVILDKTGTLTTGRPRLIAAEPVSGTGRDDLLTAAAFAETGLTHPLARAIVAVAGEHGSGGRRADRYAEGHDDMGRTVRVKGSSMSDARGTRLTVTRDGDVLGHLIVADELLPDAAATVASLSLMGLSVRIASGDSESPTRQAAAALGLPDSSVFWQQTPRQKAELIRKEGAGTVFVGDGVNDSPALAASDCGIAVAGAHAAARQTADVVIGDHGLAALPRLIRLSRRAARTSRQNLILAVVYNAALLPVLLTGHFTPDLAALAMAASSLSVMANALRVGAR